MKCQDECRHFVFLTDHPLNEDFVYCKDVVMKLKSLKV